MFISQEVRSKMLSWKLNLQVVLNLHKRTKQHIVVRSRTRNPHFSQAACVESHRGRIPKYSNVHTSLGCPLDLFFARIFSRVQNFFIDVCLSPHRIHNISRPTSAFTMFTGCPAKLSTLGFFHFSRANLIQS